jgi:hypothetical protein
VAAGFDFGGIGVVTAPRRRGDMEECLLYPQKRTLRNRIGMSALCQKRTFCAAAKTTLFDHLVGGSEQ